MQQHYVASTRSVELWRSVEGCRLDSSSQFPNIYRYRVSFIWIDLSTMSQTKVIGLMSDDVVTLFVRNFFMGNLGSMTQCIIDQSYWVIQSSWIGTNSHIVVQHSGQWHRQVENHASWTHPTPLWNWHHPSQYFIDKIFPWSHDSFRFTQNLHSAENNWNRDSSGHFIGL